MKTPSAAKPRPRRLIAGLALLLATAGAQAHQIWFEREGATLNFRYGELDVNMHEVSPGGLDRFRALSATRLSGAGEQPLALLKKADSFAVPSLTKLPGQGEAIIAIDRNYPMFDTQREGKALRTYWIPSTRWVADVQQAYAPKLPLDIVPTGVSQGDQAEFRVVFHDEPLAGVKLALVTPSGWTLQATSDIDGKFRFTLPWQGNYVIGIYHVDDAAGERKSAQGSEPYQLEGYNAALSFYKASGLAPLPVAAKTLPASVLAELAKAKAAEAKQ
jgi:hypothetical protein